MSAPSTMLDRVWDAHVVSHGEGRPDVLYVDLHLVHEVTSPQAFDVLRERSLAVRRPERTLATMDHSVATDPDAPADPRREAQLARLAENCGAHGIELHATGDAHNGVVHVMGPELGRTQPGMTIVCGDSHTSTHGAFGALAFGIGTSQVGHVLATQCLLQRRPKAFEVRVEGALGLGVRAKDLVLAIIARVGVDGGRGHVFEFTGPAVRALDMEGRMTLCNMSIEAGARAGMVAPDETTFEYLRGRPGAPSGRAWDAAVERWRRLPSDPGAVYAKTVTIDASQISPMVTCGTHPGTGIAVGARVPEGATGLDYMGIQAGAAVAGHPVDVVFVGSCTNGRLGDLRDAASVLRGRRVSGGVRMLGVPGSEEVRRGACAEGLDQIFLEAGAEWRDPGCSMCIAMNGDMLEPGQYAVSTSNRNFEGRQGPGSRTFLASPLTAAASAVAGRVADARSLP